MAQVKWIGGEGDGGVEECVGFRGINFKKGEAVEIDDPAVLETASQNPHFEVTGYEPPPEEEGGVKFWPPPSQQTVPGEVPKAGDPIPATVPKPAPAESQREFPDGQPHEPDPAKKEWPKI
jgi:hypothetical protein